MMSLADVFSEVLLPADEFITCSNESSCVDFSLFVGSLEELVDSITGSIVLINSELETWNVKLSASIASCVTSATTTHFSHCTAYS